MTQPTFTLTDNKTGQQFTAAEAEQWLIRVISDPARVHSNWEHLADIDWWLLVLAIMVNPTLRDEVWDALGDNGRPVLSDKLKFFITVNEPENDGAAKDLVRDVVRDVVAALLCRGGGS